MEFNWMQLINGGFTLFFSVFVVYWFVRYSPSFLHAWHDFTTAIKDLGASVSSNTEITSKHYEETVTVQDHLKRAIALLEDHHKNAIEIQEDMGELRKLFVELAEQIQNLQHKEES